MKKYTIRSGELLAKNEECIINTSVGTSIAIIIYDNKNKLGGICHYSLPSKAQYKDKNQFDDRYYGDSSIQDLFLELEEIGGNKENYIVKIIGAARLDKKSATSREIGEGNIKTAIEELAKKGLTIEKQSTGGEFGKRVRFNPITGECLFETISSLLLKRIESSSEQKEYRISRILLIDNNEAHLEVLKKIISNRRDFELFGIASTLKEADQLFRKRETPDIILINVGIESSSGFEYLKSTLSKLAIPSIAINSSENSELIHSVKALELGAVDSIDFQDLNNVNELSEIIKGKIRSATKIKKFLRQNLEKEIKKEFNPENINHDYFIALGASTGGTQAVTYILQNLPKAVAPIFVVLHMPEEYCTVFANRLDDLCQVQVKVAQNNEIVENGKVFIAPIGKHMAITKKENQLVISLSNEKSVNKRKPSIDVLFKSMAKEIGNRAICLLLTGNGKDGSKGLLEIKNNGGYTICQDEGSSIVFGMAKEAIKIDAADTTIPLSDIPYKIVELLSNEDSIVA